MTHSSNATTVVGELAFEPNGTLMGAAFDEPDYVDAFVVQKPDRRWETVADFATDFFERQPGWIALVSMNLTGRAKLERALGDRTYPVGHSVGSWKVYARADDEIVFGDDMGFMQYRFAMRLVATDTVIASTVVQYRWRRVSHVYFGVVKPFHRRFVPIVLRRAAGGRTEANTLLTAGS